MVSPRQDAEHPLSHESSHIPLVFLVLVRLLQEKETNDQSEDYDGGTNNVRQEVREAVEETVGLKVAGVVLDRVRKHPSEASSYD